MTVNELYAYLEASEYPARFKALMRFVFPWEIVERKGVIVVENDPDDAGGATFCGLDRRSHPSLNFEKLTPKDVCDEYLKRYWIRFNCERYPFPLGEVFANCCINAGVGRANKILATGAKTADAFLDEQEAFYRRLADQKPKLK